MSRARKLALIRRRNRMREMRLQLDLGRSLLAVRNHERELQRIDALLEDYLLQLRSWNQGNAVQLQRRQDMALRLQDATSRLREQCDRSQRQVTLVRQRLVRVQADTARVVDRCNEALRDERRALERRMERSR